MGTSQKLRSLFSNRFEPSGSGFLYRAGEGAPGVAVSAEEHRRFVAAFERHVSWLRWLCEPWLVLPVALGMAWLAYRLWNSNLATPATFWGTLLLPAGVFVWVANAPGRALKRRPNLDAGVPAREMRRRGIAGLRWRRILFDLIVAVNMLALLFHKSLGPAERIVLVAIAAAQLMAVLYVVVAKALQGRSHRGLETPR